jgi:hypothetical protein
MSWWLNSSRGSLSGEIISGVANGSFLFVYLVLLLYEYFRRLNRFVRKITSPSSL